MRWHIAWGLLPLLGPIALAGGAHAADIKGASKIESVTAYPQGAEVTRVGKVKMERGEHVILFNDLPANAVTGSIRVEGKSTGRLEIGSVDARRVKVPSTDETVGRHRAQAHRGRHREAARRSRATGAQPSRRRRRRRH